MLIFRIAAIHTDQLEFPQKEALYTSPCKIPPSYQSERRDCIMHALFPLLPFRSSLLPYTVTSPSLHLPSPSAPFSLPPPAPFLLHTLLSPPRSLRISKLSHWLRKTCPPPQVQKGTGRNHVRDSCYGINTVSSRDFYSLAYIPFCGVDVTHEKEGSEIHPGRVYLGV